MNEQFFVSVVYVQRGTFFATLTGEESVGFWIGPVALWLVLFLPIVLHPVSIRLVAANFHRLALARYLRRERSQVMN